MTEDASSHESPEEKKEKKKSDLLPRVVTAIVMVPILLGLIIWGPHWAWALFLGAATYFGLYELNDMLQQEEPQHVTVVSSLIGLALSACLYLFIGPEPVVDVRASHQALVFIGGIAGLVWLSFLFNLLRPRNIDRVAVTMTAPLAAALYIGIPFTLISMMKRDFGDAGPGWILMLLAMIWMSDTGAYFAGRAFGKNKLAPNVSPNKTIEGAVGGLVGTLSAAFVVKFLLLDFLAVIDVVVIGLVANVLGQTGDLCESLFKRSVKVKDSGTIIYGHGGMLDRVDAVLFAAPWVYLCGALADGASLLG